MNSRFTFFPSHGKGSWGAREFVKACGGDASKLKSCNSMKASRKAEVSDGLRFFGVGGSGRRPFESADPQAQRAGRLGKLGVRNLGLGGSESSTGGWGCRLPEGPKGPQRHLTFAAIYCTCDPLAPAGHFHSSARRFPPPREHFQGSPEVSNGTFGVQSWVQKPASARSERSPTALSECNTGSRSPLQHGLRSIPRHVSTAPFP